MVGKEDIVYDVHGTRRTIDHAQHVDQAMRNADIP